MSISSLNGPETVTLTLPDKPEYISLARMSAAAMANFIHMDYDEIQDIKVALSEACTNAVRHGCTNSDHYDVTLTIEDDALIITVSDNGNGYDFSQVPEPVIGDQIGGFGMHIIRSLMDSMDIESAQGKGTSITLQKNKRAGNGSEGPSQ